MSKSLLTITDLQVRFGADEPALRGASLSVEPGQTVALVGESGSGKSTLAGAVLGLLPQGGRVTGGRIVFDGEDITQLGHRRREALRGSQIGLVPQDPATNLNPVWTVGFQIREALRANGLASRRAARQRAVELLDEVGMGQAAMRAKQYPHQLSGGMCQRALIAIGLAGRPRLLIADEPTSALDVTVARQVLDHLDELAARIGTAMLFITHDLALAAERAEHLVVLHQGNVVESGPAPQVIDKPGHPYTRRLVKSAPALGTSGIRGSTSGSPPLIARHPPVGGAGLGDADNILAVQKLTKVYRVRTGLPWRHRLITAVDAASFGVCRATTTAIVGESGSGKTTVARMILGLVRPTSGTVVFDGDDVEELDRTAGFAFRRRVQPVFQNPYRSLDPMYSVYRTIEEPLRVHHLGNRVERRRRVAELLDQVALPRAVSRRHPAELSGGQRQRVAIARALALQPELLVCDEAVSALDAIVRTQILELLMELQKRLGLTYLFISHDLAVVRGIADNVAVMCEGRIVEHASTDEVFARPRDGYTQRLLNAIPGQPR